MFRFRSFKLYFLYALLQIPYPHVKLELLLDYFGDVWMMHGPDETGLNICSYHMETTPIIESCMQFTYDI